MHDFNGIVQGVRNAVRYFSDKYSVEYVCLPNSIIKGSVVITKIYRNIYLRKVESRY